MIVLILIVNNFVWRDGKGTEGRNMLDLLRRHAGSWLIEILLVAIALAFALSWGVTPYYSRGNVAVKVNDEPITTNQLSEELGHLTEEYRQQFGAQYEKDAQLLNLKERALNRAVDRALLFQAAHKIGIRVSDAEVKARVAAFPAFSRGEQFDFAQYKRVLAANKLSPEVYENMLRSSLVEERLVTLVSGSAQVTPAELEQRLEQSLTQVQGAYLLFRPEDLLAKTTASPEEIAAHYQEHKSSYMEPARVSFSCLVFSLAAFQAQVEVSDDQMAEAYERERARYYQPEAVKACHILIEVKHGAGPAEEEVAKHKAEEILSRARERKENFAALAKKHSQGPTAVQGGDLGTFSRGEMVGPFEDLAFSLKPGEVGLVRANQGWHVLKVTEHREAKVVPLEEASGEIKSRLVEKGARDRAEIAAQRAFDQVTSGVDLARLAEDAKLTLQTSPLVTADDDVPGLTGVRVLVEALEGLEPGQAAPPVSFQGGSVLAVLKDRCPEQLKPLEQVRDEVASAVKSAKAQRQALKEAQDLVKALAKEADPVKALLANPGVKHTNWLDLDDEVEGLTRSFTLVEALFLCPPGQPLVAAPVATGAGQAEAVAALTGRRGNQPKDREAQLKDLRQKLVYQKRQEAFQRFLDDLRARANIKILSQL
jgi:peptidyl-prolyl cis-trans isomerase D